MWLGLLGSFFAYILYFYLLTHIGATVSTMVTYMFPVVGVTLGVLVLGESLDARLLLGHRAGRARGWDRGPSI